MARQVEELVGKRLSQMSDDELREYLYSVRKSRASLKATSKKAVKQKKERRKAKVDVLAMLDKLSPEERAEFLRRAKEG